MVSYSYPDSAWQVYVDGDGLTVRESSHCDDDGRAVEEQYYYDNDGKFLFAVKVAERTTYSPPDPEFMRGLLNARRAQILAGYQRAQTPRGA